MYPQKYRIICAFISIAAFAIAASLFVFGFSKIATGSASLRNVTPYGFILLSLGFILIWQGVGSGGGLAFFILSVPLIMLVSLSLNSLIYNFQIIIMIGIAIPSYLFYKKSNTLLLEEDQKISRIQEEQNLLDDRLKKDAELTEAFYFKLDRYNKLKDLGEAFNAKLSLDEIYELTIDRAYEIIGKTDEAKLFLVTEDARGLVLHSCKSKQITASPSKKSDIFDKWVFNKRQPLQISDITCDFRFDYKQNKEKPQFNSLIIVPLIIQHRIIGILRLDSKEKSAYAADDLRLLDFISDLASAAINNARLYMKTEELAITDSLTGLYVHRYFKERLTEEFNLCKEEESKLSILMLDIDHFKDYNDKYGHAAGDKVLKGITDIMRGNTAEIDILARYGGEEFVVLFPGEGKRKAKSIAENIRKDIESTPFILRRQETKITISAGVASFPDDASNEEDLLKKMDFSLYKAKKEGRNKVCAS